MTEAATMPRRDSEESRLRSVRRLARFAVVGGGMLVAGFVGTQMAHADSSPTISDQLNTTVGHVTQAPMHVVEQADQVVNAAPKAVQGLTAAVITPVDTTVHNSVGTTSTVVTRTIANLHGELAPVDRLVGSLLDPSRGETTVTAQAPHTTTLATSGGGSAAHAGTTIKAAPTVLPAAGSIRYVNRTVPAGGHLTPAGSLPVPTGPAQDPAPAPAGATISPTLRHVEALRTLGLSAETAWLAPVRAATTSPGRDTAMELRLAYGSSRPD